MDFSTEPFFLKQWCCLSVGYQMTLTENINMWKKYITLTYYRHFWWSNPNFGVRINILPFIGADFKTRIVGGGVCLELAAVSFQTWFICQFKQSFSNQVLRWAFFYKTKSDILAGLGRLSCLELFFCYLYTASLSSI